MAADITTGVLGASLAGVTATAVATMGLQPESLVPAFMGAAAGSILVESIGRGKAALAFFFVVYAAALLGTVLGNAFGGGPWVTKACALFIGMFFHPLFAMTLSHLPKLFAWAAQRVGIKLDGEKLEGKQ